VLCSSESARRDYCDFTGLPTERVFVTPWAAGAEFHPEADPERMAKARAKYGLPGGTFLLSLCTLEPRKNLPHLIRAFAGMLAAEPRRDVHLVLAGAKGWEFDDIFRSIEGAGAARDRIHTPGRIEDADLAAVYSAAAGFVYPSLYEGFGLPPLEAMQCGTPVISSNTSAMPEVVGEAGLLVDPTDFGALVEAMRALLDSPELRADLRERGLQRARHFSWERTMQLTLAAYQTALAHGYG
jgi:glycosyltransferase involved in cell wall biosynthesis